MTMLRISCVIGAALLASGCANLSTVFRDFELDKGRSIMVDAQQRAILVNKVKDENGEMRTMYCAEPSPDSLFAIGASFGGSGGAALASGAKADAEVAQALVSAASDALSARNATIQLLRDGLYRACEAYASGALSRTEYAEVTWRYQKMVLAALSIELVSNLNRPRREPSVTGGNGGANGGKSGADKADPAAGATAAAGRGDEKSSAADVKAIVAAYQAGAAATRPPAPMAPPYSDAAIERISETAVFLVSAVLQSEDRVAQCLRYLSVAAQDGVRKDVDSTIEKLCAKLIEGSVVIAPTNRPNLQLR